MIVMEQKVRSFALFSESISETFLLLLVLTLLQRSILAPFFKHKHMAQQLKSIIIEIKNIVQLFVVTIIITCSIRVVWFVSK